MANFVVIVDPEPARRALFVRRVAQMLAPVEGLVIGSSDLHDFSAVWAANPRAPVSATADADSAAVVWGHALEPEQAGEVSAGRVSRRWVPLVPPVEGASDEVPFAFDGYYAAVAYRRGRGLVVGADLLGLFPVYYAAAESVLIASATPEPFRLHPLFPARLDPAGLVGILLSRGPVDGRTLLQGVLRLPAAHALVWSRSAVAPREVRQYRLPVRVTPHGSSFPDDVAALDQALEAAVTRQVPSGSPRGLLLSGGRDSRMLGAYVAERGIPLHALTLGEPGDFEVDCAVPVAQALGAAHDVATVQDSQFPWAAELQANWEHLVGGLGNVFLWGLMTPLGRLPPTLVTGYLLDSMVSGKSLKPELQVFDRLFAVVAQLSIGSEQLERLLRRRVFGDIVEATVQRLRVAFESAAPQELQRAWQFQMAHSERCHVGLMPWRLTFGSWPVLPILDRAVLDTICSIPAASLADRRAQDEIIRRRFPRLARLPLVRANGDNTEALDGSFAARALRPLSRRLRQRAESRRAANGRRDRRYYYRMYDFDSQAWRAVRRLAEPERDRLADLFEMDELAAFLPSPETTLALRHGIFDSLGRKLLIGLMLWAPGHLT